MKKDYLTKRRKEYIIYAKLNDLHPVTEKKIQIFYLNKERLFSEKKINSWQKIFAF